jgi:hypothetical protein
VNKIEIESEFFFSSVYSTPKLNGWLFSSPLLYPIESERIDRFVFAEERETFLSCIGQSSRRAQAKVYNGKKRQK